VTSPAVPVDGVLGAARNPIVRWEWVADRPDELWARTIDHLQLTVTAVGVGLVLASLLAAVALRHRWTFTPITTFTAFLYTVPSIAAFAVLVPITGLTMLTAQIVLVSYTLLILVRNIVAGIDGVPAEVRAAADGMGFTPLRRVLTVELPLAAPVILAGVRVATVTTVSLVTIAGVIGFGGLGTYLIDGFQRSFYTPTTVGAALVVLLAVVLDVALHRLEVVVTPWARRRS
jgi:osmoprotectant transport system permease protein